MSAVRQQITIAAPIRAVWKALTTEEGVRSWWADDARLDARAGGRVVLGHGAGEERVEERGLFLTLRPTSHVEISWDKTGGAPTKGTSVRFQLGRDAEEVKVHLQHSGGGILEDDAARSVLDDLWKERLQRLRASLEA